MYAVIVFRVQGDGVQFRLHGLDTWIDVQGQPCDVLITWLLAQGWKQPLLAGGGKETE